MSALLTFTHGKAAPESPVPECHGQQCDEATLSTLGIELLPRTRAHLLDPENWRESLETFARATNLAVALVDADGCLIGKCFNPQPTWRLLNDKRPATTRRCPFSLVASTPCTCVDDAMAGSDFSVARDRTGLVHFAMPLRLGDHRLGALVAGQVFDQFPEQMALEQVANSFGLPRHEAWKLARLEHPIKRDTLRVYGDLLATLGRTLLLTRHHASIEADRVAEVTRLSDLLAEANRRNEFLAMLAHELRNPLAPALNALNLMRLAPSDSEACARAREVASNQIRHLSRLVDDLVDVSRITHGRIRLRRETIELAQIVSQVEECIRPFVDAHRQQLSVSIPREPIHLDADPTRLVQVLSNLLNNAVKYTPDGGSIWFTAERSEQDVVLQVRDSGIGIEPELLPRVFDLFTQGERGLERSQGGLGIGLTMVQSLVEMHGGTVTAQSDGHGRGSALIVRLPVLPQAPDRPAGPANATERLASSPSRRIMVVDDSIDAAQSMAALLKLQGHETRVAFDGQRAIEIAARFSPQVVLLDIGMPGMNGYQVAKQLRLLPGLEQTMLVALTGYGQDEDLCRSREAGFHHHLVKPADLDAVQELIVSDRATGQ